MPSRWEIELPGVDAAAVKLEHLHAVASGWLDNDDTHRGKDKPYSVSPARHSGEGSTVEVGLLDDSLADRLATRAAPGVRVRLGSQRSRIVRQPRQVAACSWPALTTSRPATAWCLRFVTPTTFRRGDNFTPTPSLRAILASLRRTWHRFAPASVGPVTLDLAGDPLWLTDIDVTSHVVHVGGRTVSGFTGRLRFVTDAGSEVAAAVERLTRLAPYAGVGAYTTRGFGLTRQEPTWPHGTRRHTATRAARS